LFGLVRRRTYQNFTPLSLMVREGEGVEGLIFWVFAYISKTMPPTDMPTY